MSDSNTAVLAFQRETSWATAIVSPALKKMRITGESIAHAKDTVTSNEVRSDRQTADLAQVGQMASGNIEFELSYTDWLEIFESALFTTKVAINITSGNFSCAVSTQRITAASGTPFSTVIPGCYVRVAGFVTALNNGIKRVVAVGGSGANITLADGITADESTVAITVKGTQMKNGITPTSYCLERGIRNAAGTTKYQKFLGMMIDDLALKFASKAIVTGTIGWIGKSGEASDTPSNSYGAQSVDPVMNASSNVGSLERDGDTMGEKMKSFDITIKNNLRGKDAIGTGDIFEVGVGSCKVTGSFNAYFKDNALFEDFKNHAEIELGFVVTDGEGNSIAFFMPRVKLSTGNPAIPGKDADCMQACNFEAIIGESPYDGTLYISFVAA